MLLLAGAATPAVGENPFGAPAVSDAELSEMRGGFALPGGIDLSIVVRTETSVDGNLLLRSVYALDQGPATLQVFAPAPGQTVATGRGSAGSGDGEAPPAVWVMFDRDNGVSIGQAGAQPGGGLTVTTGPAAEAPDDGLAPLPIGPGGSIEVAGGTVSLQDLPRGTRARIEGDRIDVSHIVGGAFGSVIANSGSDRAIDTVTTISLDLNGATPANLGSALPRVESIALDAVRGLVE